MNQAILTQTKVTQYDYKVKFFKKLNSCKDLVSEIVCQACQKVSMSELNWDHFYISPSILQQKLNKRDSTLNCLSFICKSISGGKTSKNKPDIYDCKC